MTSTPRRLTVALGAVAIAGSLAACTVVTEGIGRDRGDTTTQTRDVSDVATVVLGTSGTVQVSVGEPSLTVTAGERVLDSIETDVDGDTLEVSMRSWIDPGPVHYDLTLPGLDRIDLRGSGRITGTIADTERLELTVSGSGEIRLDPVTTEHVQAEISGSGSIELSGQATTVDFRLPGSGRLAARDLAAQDATIDILGSGAAEVHVTETLDVRISGSGAVQHTGGAQVTQAISGSGRIEQG